MIFVSFVTGKLRFFWIPLGSKVVSTPHTQIYKIQS